MTLSIIILAAGAGTRMLSDRAKVLHEVAGAPMLAHTLATARALAPGAVTLVTGHGGAEVAAAALALDPEVRIAEQTERLGTAHAVLAAGAQAPGGAIVLYADTPLVTAETLSRMRAERAAGADVVVLGFEAVDPTGYGRLILDAAGGLARIVEEKDADAAERAVTLCNSGVVAADAALLRELCAATGNDNAKGEFYLTEIVGLARDRGLTAAVVTCAEAETLGVNSRTDLAAAEAAFQERARAEALAAGVTLQAPETVHFAFDTVIGRDATVEPYVVFGPGVTVETGARIRAFTHLEDCHIATGASVGPHARLRGGAEVGNDARIGNFVEIKGSEIGEGAKIGHLTYVGDATVGDGANLGAGTVTCNYDGVSKHRTEIGERAFIGSSTMLVAPVRVGAEAMTGSGSVITMDVEDGALAIGRGRQVTKPGLARKLMARLRAAKEGR
ncbi:MAG: bifunctional UDP-N-acetylglucosamine diphosphorylase/glucosamine-1-phosphate N-acetyltransferase GlmU [Pseudomonadota bacterium]